MGSGRWEMANGKWAMPQADGVLVNTETGTKPLYAHFNGDKARAGVGAALAA